MMVAFALLVVLPAWFAGKWSETRDRKYLVGLLASVMPWASFPLWLVLDVAGFWLSLGLLAFACGWWVYCAIFVTPPRAPPAPPGRDKWWKAALWCLPAIALLIATVLDVYEVRDVALLVFMAWILALGTVQTFLEWKKQSGDAGGSA
jgi:hypothetical protein